MSCLHTYFLLYNESFEICWWFPCWIILDSLLNLVNYMLSFLFWPHYRVIVWCHIIQKKKLVTSVLVWCMYLMPKKDQALSPCVIVTICMIKKHEMLTQNRILKSHLVYWTIGEIIWKRNITNSVDIIRSLSS